MSRQELDKIQTKLKVAIRSHQAIVAKIKSDTQNEELREKLHKLQSTITDLSDQQRGLVQALRKELLRTDANTHTNVPQPAHQQTRTFVSAHSGIQNYSIVPTCDSLNSQPADLSVRITNESSHISSTPVSNPSITTTAKATCSTIGVSSLAEQSLTSSSVDTDCSKPTSLRCVSSDKENGSLTSPNKTSHNKGKKKTDFMASIDLIPMESLKEIQGKHSERKRKTCLLPQISHNGEPQKKKIVYLLSPTHSDSIKLNDNTNSVGSSRSKGRPHKQPSVNRSLHDGQVRSLHDGQKPKETCALCHTSVVSFEYSCKSCKKFVHKHCIDDPSHNREYTCPDCQCRIKMESVRQENLAIVHSYVVSKAAKEEEKKRLQKKNQDLISEKSMLEKRRKELTDCLNKQANERQELIALNKSAEEAVTNIKNFVCLFQT